MTTLVENSISAPKEPEIIAPPQQVLAIGAHPDDLELAAGGALSRLVQGGAHVHGVVMSHGRDGGFAEHRVLEAKRAAHLLGFQSIEVFDYPDRNLASHSTDMIATVEGKIREFEPSLILTHSVHDNHQDHHAVHLAVIRAARKRASILCFESPSVSSDFKPSVYVDVSDHIQTKIDAVKIHEDQSGKPYVSDSHVSAVARFRGLQAKCEYAEAFEPIRLLVGDLVMQ